MSGHNIETLVSVAAPSDPGEIGRANHRWWDRLMINIGNTVAWLFPILMVAIVAQVIMRQAGNNQAWLDDAQWWMYGFAMLTGFGYAITTQSHVRVDILHALYSDRKKARIEVFAIGWLLMPFLLIMTDVLIHYAWASIVAGEGSDSPNGLHGLYLLKTSLPVMFIVAILAAWGVFYRNLIVFSRVSLVKVLLWALPSALFLIARLIHYALYWLYFLTQPDLNPRRITNEPLFDSVGPMALGVFAALLCLSFVLSKTSKSGE
ncbi:MAG: TRAP transporter small permease subunit [Roseobacter sp.]